MIRTCLADDCCNLLAVTGHGSRARLYCSRTCKSRISKRRVRTMSPHLALCSERDRIVARVAGRLAARHSYNELAALDRFSDFELDLLAQMEVA